jgi:hypothetical protein
MFDVLAGCCVIPHGTQTVYEPRALVARLEFQPPLTKHRRRKLTLLFAEPPTPTYTPFQNPIQLQLQKANGTPRRTAPLRTRILHPRAARAQRRWLARRPERERVVALFAHAGLRARQAPRERQHRSGSRVVRRGDICRASLGRTVRARLE